MARASANVSVRLAAGFGLVLGLLAVVAATGLLRLSQLNRELETIANVSTAELVESASLLETVDASAIKLRNLLLFDDLRQVKSEIAAVRAARQTSQSIIDSLQKHVETGRKQDLFNAILATREALVPQEEEVLKLAEAGDHATAKELMLGKALRTQIGFITSVRKFSEFIVEQARQDAQAAHANYESGRRLIIGFALLALLAGSAASFLIARGIVRQLGGEPSYAATVANAIAEGDLSSPVRLRAGDGGSLLYAMRRMQENLGSIVGAVRAAADAVSAGAEQLAADTRSLAQRSEEQASSLEETAASVEQLSSTVKGNSGNARQAEELARNASVTAEAGGTAVRQVVQTMDEITASSRRISDIIAVIDAIAFQTNILALNAAVEAARAGDQGRGFAVVASEVRALAQRSADAAREIKELIGGSVSHVEEGARQVTDAGTTIERLVADVKRVSDLMSEIAHASIEQGQGIEQISKTVSQVEAVVGKNVSAVENSAAAADSMRVHATRLVEVVGKFRLSDEVAPAPEASAVTPLPAQPALLPRTATA